MVRNGCGQSGYRTLKLTVSQEWIDGMNWIFVCWCKFRKAKSCIIDFWVGMVENGHGHLVHETLKSAEWVYELSWFFPCWLWCNNFCSEKHCNLYVWLLNVSLLELYLLDPQQYLEGSYEIGSVHHSLLPSVWVFSWNRIIRFSEFWYGAGNPYEVVHGSLTLWKNIFCPKNWGNGPEIGFFEFEEKFGH